MPHNPKFSGQVTAYPELPLFRRMKKIMRVKPRFTLSYQVQEALKAHIDRLEEEAGLKPKNFLPS